MEEEEEDESDEPHIMQKRKLPSRPPSVVPQRSQTRKEPVEALRDSSWPHSWQCTQRHAQLSHETESCGEWIEGIERVSR